VYNNFLLRCWRGEIKSCARHGFREKIMSELFLILLIAFVIHIAILVFFMIKVSVISRSSQETKEQLYYIMKMMYSEKNKKDQTKIDTENKENKEFTNSI
jgi:uncharacterized BrkB/YihY/UPF0761 family membrane protein